MSHDSVWGQYAMYRDALNASGRQVYLQTCNTLHYDDPFPEMRKGGGFAATMPPCPYSPYGFPILCLPGP